MNLREHNQEYLIILTDSRAGNPLVPGDLVTHHSNRKLMGTIISVISSPNHSYSHVMWSTQFVR